MFAINLSVSITKKKGIIIKELKELRKKYNLSEHRQKQLEFVLQLFAQNPECLDYFCRIFYSQIYGESFFEDKSTTRYHF